MRPALVATLSLAAAGALLASAPPAPARGQDPPPPLALSVFSYQLSASWNEQQWQARPGHFAETGDITTLPDGRLIILDRRLNALHELDAEGHPLDLWANPDHKSDSASPWRWQRLDAGADGRLHVLSRAETGGTAGTPRVVRWQLDHLDGSGRRVGAIDLGTVSPERYVDVAARADGRLYLVRTDGNVASRGDISYGIDVFSASGEKLETLTPPQFTIPLTLDLAPDGSLYVVDQFPHTGQTPAPGKVDGVAVFGPDHAYRRTIRFSGASDVAVGAGGTVYVSRNNELFQVAPGEPRLLFSGPTIQKNPYALTSLGRPEMFSVDLRPDGRVVASLSHCSFQGLVELDAADSEGAGSRARLSGELDAPQLRGPIHPWRIAASGERTAILQARYEPAPPDMAGSLGAPYLQQRYTTDAQTILTYQGDRLIGQTGACGVWNQPWGVKDIAMDGADLWTIDAQALRLRHGAGVEPERVFALSLLDDPLASPQLTAISAQGGRAAILDQGSGAVILVDRNLTRIGQPLALSDTMATDLALFGRRVALAQGREVLLLDLGDVAGAPPHRLEAPGPVAALAYGPSGELVVLTADGWLARYGAMPDEVEDLPEGITGPESLWRVPDDRAQPRDLAVDGQGRVLVTWTENAPYGAPSGGIDASGSLLIKAAGVWVFQPTRTAGLTMAPPGSWSDGCVLAGSKQLQPSTVRAGETVTVTLSAEGRCPAARQPLDLVVVVDVAKSMANDYGLDRARAALFDLLPRLTAHDVRVALVAAGTDGSILQHLQPQTPELGRLLAELTPAGDRRLALGLALAESALARGSQPGRRQAVLVLTDGAAPASADDVAPAVASLGAKKVAVRVWLHPGRFVSATELQGLDAGFGKDATLAVEGPESAAILADWLTAAKPFLGDLAAALEVVDSVAPGMTLIDGSILPAATVDPATGGLRWSLKAQLQDRDIQLRYRLRADRIGSRVPVDNLAATAAYTDGLGIAGGFPFPRPLLRVRGAGEALLPRTDH